MKQTYDPATRDKMLKEGTKEHVEFGSKKVGDIKVEHGFRMRFLDDVKDEEQT